MPPTEPLFVWSDVVTEFIGFIALFLATGAVGFRFAVVSRVRSNNPVERAALDGATLRAAWLGLVGAIVTAVMTVIDLPGVAEERHTTVAALLGTAPTLLEIGFVALVVVGLVLAVCRLGAGWPIAALGIVGGALRSAFLGRWTGLINPVHALAGGLWIGTLFMLVVAGLGTVLGSSITPARRGPLTADLVRAFSPLAQGSVALLGTMGVITAWRHLHRLSALWTTPYGYTLIAKLAIVFCVLQLGFYHWKTLTPLLGEESSGRVLKRSATLELTLAFCVLIATALLVSMPSPRK